MHVPDFTLHRETFNSRNAAPRNDILETGALFYGYFDEFINTMLFIVALEWANQHGFI